LPIATNDYYIAYAAKHFTQGVEFDTTGLVYQEHLLQDNPTLNHIIGRIQNDAGPWEKLTPSECISAYATDSWAPTDGSSGLRCHTSTLENPAIMVHAYTGHYLTLMNTASEQQSGLSAMVFMPGEKYSA
jgi:hypothetical protein